MEKPMCHYQSFVGHCPSAFQGEIRRSRAPVFQHGTFTAPLETNSCCAASDAPWTILRKEICQNWNHCQFIASPNETGALESGLDTLYNGTYVRSAVKWFKTNWKLRTHAQVFVGLAAKPAVFSTGSPCQVQLPR